MKTPVSSSASAVACPAGDVLKPGHAGKPVAILVTFMFITFSAWSGETNIDLLKRYPTTLTSGDVQHTRPWNFTAADLFHISRFELEVGKGFRMTTGPADLGIGHCADGAVWAVVIPQSESKLTSPAVDGPEAISHVWLRFHPGEIDRLFPPETVSSGDKNQSLAQMQAIAHLKFTSSWHGGGEALIPEPKDLTVDLDIKGGPRRFFVVNTVARTAEYVKAFEKRSLKLPPSITPELAAKTFDQLWEVFDKDYAMFVLRPEVDWNALREKYRPLALKSASTYQLAEVCAEMLRPLRDLHIGLTLAGAEVPVFNRPRSSNANPAADTAIPGELNGRGRVQWAITPDKIGYIVIYGWSDESVPIACDEALEKLRDTRALIVDVRLNGGGGEPWAGQFAGRFLKDSFVYAFSQFRNGPGHTNLTEKYERRVEPRGPWRYEHKVIVLIGQKCMSSNESFVGMMTGDPDAVTMGDHTCGSSGNPKIVELPLSMTVRLPQWIDYLPDGTLLDERGFQPQIQFKAGEEAFEGNRDDLLTAAFERLRKTE